MNEITQDEKRICIAKACGWTDVIDCGHGISRGDNPYDGRRLHIPNYFVSLDAMREAELSLSPADFERFRWMVWDAVKRPLISEWNRAYLSAPADVRAEAFGKVMSLW